MRFSLASDLGQELASMLRGYPAFVWRPGAQALAAHLPVFVYHGLRPDAFERDLAFLADNGYRTVGMDELVRHMSGGGVAERSVVLTFDDARSSFWRFGFPLLERYGMRGVLFVIAGLTLDAPACRPNLSSVWSGDCTLSDLDALDPDDSTLCTWPELERMHASGRVEVESHSLFHREVFVGTDVVDFVVPGTSFVPFATPVTAYLEREDVGRPIEPARLLGLPLFRSAPLHAALPAWLVPPELRRVAADVWREVGRQARSRAGARRALAERWRRIDVAARLRRQTADEVAAAIEEDLAAARDLIKARVDERAGEHFCVPYGVASDVTIAAAERLGVRSVSWGVIAGKKHNAPGDSPLRVVRVKCDFLWRLPAGGRASLGRVYARKVLRRLCGERAY